ncbi:MAG: FtsX-like permease family protein [Aerococcus sp.]|nr:FtsX-like permease family protein [Aerococcus sp.]
MIQKKSLWKDIFKSISHSKGRFLSILGLMLLGAFALVGLQVTGPDMRDTGRHYLKDLNVADMAVIGTLGIDEEDQKVIDQVKGVNKIEYGYLKDVTLKDSTDSFRLFSKTDDISHYEVREGRLPEKADEVAISATYADKYHIGDTIDFNEAEDASGNKVLKDPHYKIVGFVYSGEILSSNNLGQSTAGTGSLKGYGVLTPDAFDSDVYMVARLRFDDLLDVDPYSEDYTNKLQAHKDDLDDKLKNQPNHRLNAVKQEYQDQIDDGQKKIDDANKELADKEQQLKDAKKQLEEGSQKIADAQAELTKQVNNAQGQINDGANQIANAKSQLASGQQQLASAKQQLNAGAKALDERWQQLASGQQQLNAAKQKLNASNQQLSAGAKKLTQGQNQIAQGYQALAASQQQLQEAEGQIKQAEQQLAAGQKQWNDQKASYDQSNATFQKKQQAYQKNSAQIDQAQQAIDSKKTELENGRNQYNQAIADLTNQEQALQKQLEYPDLKDEEKATLESQLKTVREKLMQTKSQLDSFNRDTYEPGIQTLQEKQKELDTKKTALNEAKQSLDAAEQKLTAAKQKLDQGKQILDNNQSILNQKKQALEQGKKDFQTAQNKLASGEKNLKREQVAYQQGLNEYNAGIQSYNANLNTYYAGVSAWQQGMNQLNQKSQEYQANADRLKTAEQALANKEQELATAKDELATKKADGERQIADSKQTLADKQKEYDDNKKAFDDKKQDAEKEINDKQDELDEAKEELNHLSLPTYSISSRREIPGGEGTQIYTNTANIVDALANIFPIFLYFVAALVAFTTMGRFVDEERINAGTLKALGYDDKDIFKKFAFYGLTAGLTGTVIGIALGHTLIPSIAYNAYKVGITLPKIEWHFHWRITLIALVLSLLSSVLPAWIATKQELTERPAQLLLPKPPAAGSKIFLERLPHLWGRMNFTHKVTARNIFRYKQRMLMTIFGVAGAVALLFTGLSVQNSIGGINDKQFGDIIHYDMIVAQNDYLTADESKEINDRLNSDQVKEYTPIHYESLTKVAGRNKDKQDIKLLVPEDTNTFKDYISLRERKSQTAISLPDDGVVISERLAQLIDAKVGETVTFTDDEDQEREMKVAGITEMYMGHFAFMSPTAYSDTFHKDYETDAEMVKLNDSSMSNIEKEASAFMEYTGVLNVLQNTTFTNLIETIVHSMNKVLQVLIIIAGLLGIVILYNLTNINVSERMRELSTIKVLGFYDKEVTLYIYRETILLTIIGIFVGYGIGELLHQYILRVVPPENIMFDPTNAPMNFIVPAIVIIVITTVLAFVIHERLKRVDMLEALSSVE